MQKAKSMGFWSQMGEYEICGLKNRIEFRGKYQLRFRSCFDKIFNYNRKSIRIS
jgi:hypothetical protein